MPASEETSDARPPRVLIVDDDAGTREMLAIHLRALGWTIAAVGDGVRALRSARAETFDLILLDVMLPELDGLSVCRAIRRDSPNARAAILMITGRGAEADRVAGLDSGADDYLVKPFGAGELMARIRAVRRRLSPPAADAAVPPSAPVVAAGRVAIDPARRHVYVGRRAVPLTTQEFAVLYLLAAHRGIVFSREALVHRLWPPERAGARSVDTVVARLRRKLAAVGAGQPIATVWGAGYKFDGEASGASAAQSQRANDK